MAKVCRDMTEFCVRPGSARLAPPFSLLSLLISASVQTTWILSIHPLVHRLLARSSVLCHLRPRGRAGHRIKRWARHYAAQRLRTNLPGPVPATSSPAPAFGDWALFKLVHRRWWFGVNTRLYCAAPCSRMAGKQRHNIILVLLCPRSRGHRRKQRYMLPAPEPKPPSQISLTMDTSYHPRH